MAEFGTAAFSLNILRRVEVGFTACGKFDGSHACLAAATSGGNVLVHSPHRVATARNDENDNFSGRLSWSGELAELHIGRQVTALCTGRLGEDERDVLLVGTSTHILAYQVEDNADLFYKEMPDGAYCISVGKLSWLQNQVAIIGGNCSITVLDRQGSEIYWTVASDKVTSVTAIDFNGDGENELLSGTAGFALRVQKEDAVVWETKESGTVVVLTPLSERQFAYAVTTDGNGTVGVYEEGQRRWRVKSKPLVVSVRAFDINGDGNMELLTAWNNGKLDARNCVTGEVIFRLQMGSPIAGLVEADYRRTGRSDLVIVTTSGEIRGYACGSAIETPEPGDAFRSLLAKKQALQLELKQRTVSLPDYYIGSKLADCLVSARGAVHLGLACGPGLVIHWAMIFAEGCFQGESLVAHPGRPGGELDIEMKFPKNGAIDIHVKTAVGSPGTDLLQVFEFTRHLPQFCMYEVVPRPDEIPADLLECGVAFEAADRPQRIALWLNQCLILPEEIEVTDMGPKAGCLEVWLRGLRDDKFHCLEADNSRRVSFRTEDPSFAGDVVQSLAMYLGIRELTSEAKFPLEEERMVEALERVKGLKEVDARLQAEAAGSSTLLKNIVIRLEDARILENIDDMRRRLTQLKAINGDLIREHEIRTKSHGQLTATLKDLNSGIDNAARLRVGKAAANTVTRCRAALQEENPKALLHALRNG